MTQIDWNEIQKEWESTKITLVALAEKHDIKLGTIKSRRSRDKWSRAAINKDATSKKKDATNSKKGASSKKPRYPNNGNPGNENPENQFAERNQAAKKHGLFSRYIPKETLELMGMINNANLLDLLWDQIQIQFAAIIRAQKVM